MFKKKQQGEKDAALSPGAAAQKKGVKPFLKRNWKRIAAGAAVVAVAAVLFLPKNNAVPTAGSVNYVQTNPQRRAITNVFSDSGTIMAANTYEVRPLVRGTVLTADFEEGDVVQAGDVLYTIDSSDAANSVERAQLSANQAERSYEDAVNAAYVRSDIGGTVVSVKVAPGDVVTAGQEVAPVRDDGTVLLTVDFPAADAAAFGPGQAALVTLDGTYETVTGTIRSVSGADTLSEGNMLVRQVTIAVPNAGALTSAQAATASVNGVSALGSARLAYQNAQTLTADTSGTVAALCVSAGSRVAAGSAVLQLSSDSLTRQAEQAADSLRSAELSMQDAENTLDDYTITAPISGTIIQKNVQAGETIGADTSTSEVLCIIHDLDYLEMEIAVDELDILTIRKGQQATIVADALEEVTIRIDDYGALMPGMNATVSIVVESAEDALAIPNGAVVRGGYVLVTEDSPSAANADPAMTAPAGYVYVKVATGVSDDSFIEVTDGLTEGDTIAYDADAAALALSGDSGMMGGMPGGMPGGGMGGGPGGGGPGGGF